MTGHESAGRLDAEFFASGNSFIQFVQAHRPELLNSERVIPESIPVAQDQVPHGTTVLALTYVTAGRPRIRATWRFHQYTDDPVDTNVGDFATKKALQDWAAFN